MPDEKDEQFPENSPFRYGGEVYESPATPAAVKIVRKFEMPKADPTGIKATELEKQWLELFMQSGNATWACLQTWPKMRNNPNYARTKGSHLMRKFSVKHMSKRIKQEQTARKAMREALNPSLDKETNIIQHTKKLYMTGAIKEEELYRRMDELSRCSISDQARIVATREIRSWLKEAQAEVEANNLAMQDVVSLMINALSDLPKSKYMEVIRGCRVKRQKLIRERSAIYDAEEIRQKERERLMRSGGVQWTPEPAI